MASRAGGACLDHGTAHLQTWRQRALEDVRHVPVRPPLPFKLKRK
jgi:hypothetical protein